MTRRNDLPAAMEARRNVKTRYVLEKHVVEIVGEHGRWTASVDGVPLEARFGSSSEAWTAGIVEADRRDGREPG